MRSALPPTHRFALLLSAVAGLAVPVAVAQTTTEAPKAPSDAPKTTESAPSEMPTIAIKTVAWTDEVSQQIGSMLSGSRSGVVELDGKKVELRMNAAPVVIEGLPGTIYAEIATGESLHVPFAQTVYQVYSSGSDHYLKTMSFRRRNGFLDSVVGLWAAPDAWPAKITAADLVATMNYKLTTTDGGKTWKGQSETRFPIVGNTADVMSGAITITADGIQTEDRGFKADGTQVWGPKPGEAYAFARCENPVVVRNIQGVITLDYPSTITSAAAKEGDQCAIQYVGFFEDGFPFDSSYERGEVFRYNVGQPLMQGWNLANTDLRAGLKRRMYIPSAMAYGEQGNRRSKIPPNANLYYFIEVLEVAPPPAPAPAPTPPVDPNRATQVTPPPAAPAPATEAPKP